MLRNRRARVEPRRHIRGNKSRTSRADRQSALRLEQLEPRTMLSSNPVLSIPTTLVGSRNGIVAVPINVNQLTDNLSGFLSDGIGGTPATPLQATLASLRYINATRIGLSSADFAVDFDPNVFTVSRSDVHLGTIPSNIVAILPPSIQSNATLTQVGWSVTTSISPTNPGQ